MDSKEQIVQALIILMDLDKDDNKDLMKLKVGTLNRLFEGQKKNALSYQHMYELYKAKK